MRSQEQAFRAYYGSMPDAELLQVAANRGSFIAVAQRVLRDELGKRRLLAPEPAAAPSRHSIFWNWGNHLARWTRRPHHHPASP